MDVIEGKPQASERLLCGWIDMGEGRAQFVSTCEPGVALTLISGAIESIRLQAFAAALKAEQAKESRIVKLENVKNG